jgi:hypothetical protein
MAKIGSSREGATAEIHAKLDQISRQGGEINENASEFLAST